MLTMRAAVRRLRMVPVLGPLALRVRPFARPAVHLFYRTRNRLVALRRCSAQLTWLLRQWQRWLAAQFAWPPPWWQRWLAAQQSPKNWAAIAPLRPLLREKIGPFSFKRRLRRRWLKIILALPDRDYRRAFVRFGRMIEGARRAPPPAKSPAGIMMIAATLGPGGAERQLVTTLSELRARGHGPLELACLFLTTPSQRFFLPQVEAARVPITMIGGGDVDSVDRCAAAAIAALPTDIGSIIEYAALFAAKRPAVAHLWLDEINVKGGIAAVATGVPRVILSLRSAPPHNFEFHQPYMREGYRWLARQRGVSLVANSHAGARAYERWIGLRRGAIGCIHNGFRFDEKVLNRYRAGRGSYRARLGIPPEAPLIGGVFRLSEEKRPLLWLEIAAAVRRALPLVRFLVVGGGPLCADMKQRAAAADLAGAVHFAGQERDVFAAIADMDLLLLASRLEGLPNVLIEAQALGVPVATTPAGGAPETVVDGGTGIVLKHSSPKAAAASIVRLLSDENRLREMRRRAPIFVANAFAIERSLAETVSLYRTDAGVRPAPEATAIESRGRRTLRMARVVFRRLETAPMIGAQVSRLRPLAYLMVRIANALISLRHGSDARFTDGVGRLRQLLAVRPLHYLWLAALPFRPLLGEAPRRLSLWRRVQRRLLIVFLALPDPLYRRALAHFGRKIRVPAVAASASSPRSGLLMMIGALGAGGAERQLVTILQELKARGAPLLGLAWLNPPPPEARFFLPALQMADIPVCTIGDPAVDALAPQVASAIAGLPVDLQTVRGYAMTFAAMRPAIAHLWLDEINVRGGIAAVAAGVPRIILGLRNVPPHNFVFHHPYMREGYRWLARQAGVSLVNNSRAGARAYEAWLGLPEGSIGCIHNGFRFDADEIAGYRAGRGAYRERIGIPPDVPLVGGVFRLSEEKRPLLWLAIAAAVRRALPQAQFVVVGGGPLREAMERRAAAADLAGTVHFAGYEREVLGAMADMDVFLLSSRLEGLPNVLVEAQALGVPVVTMNVGGAPETVLDGQTGSVLQGDDPEQAAAVLARILLDADWRQEAARRAQAFVAGSFSVARMVDGYSRLYEDDGRRWLHQ